MPLARQRYRLLDYLGAGIDKLVFQVDPTNNYSAEAFVLVGPDGEPVGTETNPLTVAGGSSSAGAADISDRAARILGHTLIDNFPTAFTIENFPATQPVSGPLTDAQLRAGPLSVHDKTANTLGVSVTAAAGAAVTATLPAPGAGLYQFLELLEITMYSTVARTGTATPVVITSTNLPTAHAWTFPTAAPIGTTVTMLVQPTHPIRAANANQPVTFVCPATTGVIWRINVSYRSDSP